MCKSGLVNMLATISDVGIHIVEKEPFVMCSRIK
jgi:hypothetical protein